MGRPQWDFSVKHVDDCFLLRSPDGKDRILTCLPGPRRPVLTGPTSSSSPPRILCSSFLSPPSSLPLSLLTSLSPSLPHSLLPSFCSVLPSSLLTLLPPSFLSPPQPTSGLPVHLSLTSHLRSNKPLISSQSSLISEKNQLQQSAL
eukprot:50173-Hanusia_phi.AAC.1